jgi:hypothetical protein
MSAVGSRYRKTDIENMTADTSLCVCNSDVYNLVACCVKTAQRIE